MGVFLSCQKHKCEDVCVCVCVHVYVCGTMDELLVSRAHNLKVVSLNLSPDM